MVLWTLNYNFSWSVETMFKNHVEINLGVYVIYKIHLEMVDFVCLIIIIL